MPTSPTEQHDAHFRIDALDDGAVFRITRPNRLNAITRPVLQGLADCLDALEARGARVVIVTAEGERAFCAGTDLAEAQEMGDDEMIAKSGRARDLFLRMSRSRVLSVAAVNGLAFGGGLELAMACTMRIAAPHAQCSLPEVKLGLLPAYGGTQFLPALVGKARALDLMLTGRPVGAAEALAMGLVDRIATAERPLLEQALELARSVTQYSQVAIDAIRECLDAAGPDVTESGLAAEDAAVRRVMRSDDAREGVAAFLAKRPPVFRHR